jgi:hypothetical protein
MINAAELAWLISKTDLLQDQKGRRYLLEGVINFKESLETMEKADPYRSAAEVLCLSSNKGDLPFKAALLFALYRLYSSSIRLMIIREDINIINKIANTNNVNQLIKWLKERSLTVHKRIPERSDSGKRHFYFSLPRGTAAPGEREKHVLMREGECFLMIVDEKTGSKGFLPRNMNVKTIWIKSDPVGFEELNLDLNRELYQRIRSPGSTGEEQPWIELAGLSGSGEKKLGSMSAGQRFLFHLSNMASFEKDRQCWVVEKPSLRHSEENFFWNIISELLRQGKAAMVITNSPGNIASGNRIGIINDGVYLGSMDRTEIDETPAFLWCRCRVVNPETARVVPPHHLKIETLTGDLWMALGPERERSDFFRSFLLENYGILIHPRESQRPTMEERLIRALKDRTITSELSWI